MRYLHQEFQGGPNAVVQVDISQQANVMLVDSINYAHYRSGRRFTYYGGWAEASPVRLSPPHHGHWHVVVDMGGRAGTLRANIQVFGVAC